MASRNTPLTIDRIDHVLLLVDGLDRSLDFYERVLGCVVESRLPHYGMVELRAGSSHIDLVDVASDSGAWARPESGIGRNVDHVALRLARGTENDVRSHLGECGIEISEERVEEDGRASFYVRDPSGNTLELIALP